MSTVTHARASIAAVRTNRNHLWLIAAISPLLIAPVWTAIPQVALGPLHTFSGLLLVLLLAVATASDLSQRKIFNWTTYTAFGWALAISLFPAPIPVNPGAIGLLNSLCGAVACFVLMLIPYALARGGAGDVKLATAIGALTGMDNGMLIIAFTYIIAATAIVGWTIWNSGPLNLLAGMMKRVGARWLPQYVMPPTQPQNLLLDQPIPLAGFFAIATLLIVFDVPAFLGSL